MNAVGRFWNKVDRSGDCWLWKGAVTSAGYGLFSVGGRPENGGRKVLAHRFSYQLEVGDPGSHLDHRHTCPKICVNPSHLRPVTNKQNMENLAGARRDSASGIRGVYWDESRSKWQAYLKHNGKKIHLGRFLTLEEAEAAVVAKRNELFTHNDMDRTG